MNKKKNRAPAPGPLAAMAAAAFGAVALLAGCRTSTLSKDVAGDETADDDLARAALMACLQPNRRVEVEVAGEG